MSSKTVILRHYDRSQNQESRLIGVKSKVWALAGSFLGLDFFDFVC